MYSPKQNGKASGKNLLLLFFAPLATTDIFPSFSVNSQISLSFSFRSATLITAPLLLKIDRKPSPIF
jgi:hypothetical protein